MIWALRISILAGLVLHQFVEASLRIRHTNCDNLRPETDCRHAMSYQKRVQDSLLSGIWDGFHPEYGFDSVAADDFGDTSNAPSFRAGWWIDSIYEEQQPMGIPFIRNNVTDPIGDDVNTIVHRGVTYLAGGLKIDQAGEYKFNLDWRGRQMVLWIDKNNDGQIDLETESEVIYGTLEPHGWVSDKSANITETVSFSDPGVYKILAFFLDWYKHDSYAKLSWLPPGEEKMHPIPASAFGKRRQFGLPVPKITVAKTTGSSKQISDTVVVDECEPVYFEGTASNHQGKELDFGWDFGLEQALDPDLEVCPGNTTVMHFPCFGWGCTDYRVELYARGQGENWSNPSVTTRIYIKVNNDINVNSCSEGNVCGGNTGILPQMPGYAGDSEWRTRVLGRGGKLYFGLEKRDAAGRNGP